MKARKARPSIPAIRRAAALLALCAAGALPVSAASQERAVNPAGEVLIDPTVLDQLGRDPYGRAGPPPSPAQQQRKPQLKPPAKSTVPKAAPAAPGSQSQMLQEWTPAPYATLPPGGLLPPPGPGELERRQAEINAALGRVQPAPAQPPPLAAAAPPAKQPAKPPAQPAAAKKPAPAAKAPSAAPATPVTVAPAAPATAAPAYRLPQFQQPPAQTSAGPAPAVPPLPGSAAAVATPEPPPMAPPTPPPQGFAAPDRPSVAPIVAPKAAPPPASVPMAAAPAPVAIAPPAKPPSAQAPATPPAAPPAATRAAAPASAPAAQATPRAPQAEPAFVPSGKTAARVGFLAGSSDLPENAKPQLKAVADQMNRDGEMRVQLLAYAGPREDTASQTRRLSLFRALAVRSYLIEQGIRSTRMDVRAMGNKFEEEPADRVDVVIADR
jgi:outer membrane protein OmpA-like peptidoglycan-associated protein